MRKYLLLFVLMLLSGMLLKSQIPNAGFENWTEQSFEKPGGWTFILGKVSKVSPGYESSYAVRLESDDEMENPGVVLYGFSDNGMEFSNGLPFNYKPDSIQGYFKYDIQPNDSAAILVILKKAGNMVAFNWFFIKGTQTDKFVKHKFKIEYLDDTQTPDTLIIGFASTLENTQNNTGYFIVDEVSFPGIDYQIPNGDFETWDTNSLELLNGWTSMNVEAFMRGFPVPLEKSEDSYEGTYSAVLQNRIINQDTLYGVMMTGNLLGDWGAPSFPVSDKPLELRGYYKFLVEKSDTMMIGIQMYKQGMPIGAGYFLSGEAQSEYKEFVIDINYNNNEEMPDSASIIITTCFSSENLMPRGNSKLYLDAFKFANILVSTGDKNPMLNTVKIYPNPVKRLSKISYGIGTQTDVRIELYDLLGKRVSVLYEGTQTAGNYSIPINKEELTNGIYILKLTTDKNTISRKLIIE